ncbi:MULTISPECIES: tyrosine-type recombinase/integrase [unclassified Polaromonas]|uniref:tyrosine-type recombinase/integrase n=1 Tax=unclassified Polaromonas TaxID=2638319 RepID=UPI0018C9EDD6|nr:MULTISPECIES: tyrosine-type recombinase/integrase [unclassified Polaromonas]MBG6073666.1 integrase [Polaromonas sp. CG_9.7]MBG6115668.1 integrase [Polaromonas sp. CG_9.2]MDH6186612.1 integrase [Polaromonas sp. CG_23.6]
MTPLPAKPTQPALAHPRFVRRLGPHHFAQLRAAAEGLNLAECARRYLGIEHGHEAKTAHQEAVDAVRAVARRRGESAWRLVGLTIRVPGGEVRPSLDAFAQQHGLDGFSESEVLTLYAEAFPLERKAARSQRLRERQLELLRRLEGVAAETPQPSDMVAGWFEEALATKLVTAGLLTLGALNARISAGGRWFAALPAVGVAKARRIERHLATLLPRDVQPPRPLFALSATPALFGAPSPARTSRAPDAPTDEASGLRALEEVTQTAVARPLLDVNSDGQAVQSWIQARAGSLATVRVYQREAHRLLLWLQYERGGARLAQMTVADCGAFMAFLQNIPPRWISRARAAPGQPGWAPFRGPLSHASCRQAVVIIASLFAWLQSAQYLSANPWVLVNQATGDDPGHKMLDTKAFSEAAMLEVLRFVDGQAPSPSSARIRFILLFVEAVGLRSAELLSATLGDLRLEPEGWVMQVRGKGAKNRIAAVPGQALAALQDYLQVRGLGSIQEAPPDAPLLASSLDPMAPIGYQALYEHVKGWLAKAVRASSLPANERERLAGATTHWLRHTFGTRAIARQVPLDVIQAQMGHASIQTTTAIYGRAPIKRRVDELGKAFSG